jgi:hypothetical protein
MRRGLCNRKNMYHSRCKAGDGLAPSVRASHLRGTSRAVQHRFCTQVATTKKITPTLEDKRGMWNCGAFYRKMLHDEATCAAGGIDSHEFMGGSTVPIFPHFDLLPHISCHSCAARISPACLFGIARAGSSSFDREPGAVRTRLRYPSRCAFPAAFSALTSNSLAAQ